MPSEEPKERKLLKKRRWRVAVYLGVLAFASVLFQFVIEAPINLPDSFLALPFLSLWQPLFGLPLVAFSIWWILDRKMPLLALIIPLVLIAYCGRLLIGSPPQQSMERETLIEMMPEEGDMTEHERLSLMEMEQEMEIENCPRYKRHFFPPFGR